MSAQTLTELRSKPTQKGCAAMAWDCQSHTFMGSPETVMNAIATLPDDLIGRRVFMAMVQGDNRAEAHFFERFNIEDTEGTVSSWENDNLDGMVSQITEVLAGNRGVHCPGEQVKAALDGDREFSVAAPIPAPKTATAAFAPVIDGFKGDSFVQVTVMALC